MSYRFGHGCLEHQCQSSSSGSSSPVGYSSNGQVYKEKKLLNCFPSLARPENIVDSPVDQEYEEMTVDEIINGKVGGGSFRAMVYMNSNNVSRRAPHSQVY